MLGRRRDRGGQRRPLRRRHQQPAGRSDRCASTGSAARRPHTVGPAAPCRAESPGLEQVYAANKARGVAFVGVDERDGLAAARTFTLDKGVTYPSLFDDTGALVTSWPAGPAIPFTFVVDRRGRIASRFTGAVLPSDLQPAVTRAGDEP